VRTRWTAGASARAARFVLGVAVLGAAYAPAQAQSDSLGLPIPIPTVDDFIYDGRVSEWRGRPLDRVLSATDGRPQALIWLGQVEDGLVVAAELRGGAVTGGLAALAIALAGPEDPAFPPIGWGHQFGFEVLPDSSACAESEVDFGEEDCLAWLGEQRAHRDRIRPLFQRRWHLDAEDPGAMVEVLATPAFDRLPDTDRVAPLSPGGQPGALSRVIAGVEGGLGIEVLIPWSAFPPVRAPDLDAVRIEVDWADADPSGDRTLGGLAGQLARPLSKPLRHTTPCNAGLAGLLISRAGSAPRRASPGAVGYMIPTGSGDLSNLIILDNHARGYQYAPEPGTRSPQAFESHYQVLDLGDGTALCGPILALANESGRLSPSDWTHTGLDDPPVGYVDLEDVEVRALEDGNLLVLSGPRVWSSYFGSGQCGACPRVGVEIFHITKATGEVRPVLRYLDVAEPGTRDFEIVVSADWREVRTYASEVADFATDPIEVRWSSQRYCFIDTAPPTYEKCGEKANVPEPPVVLRSFYRDF